MQRVMLIGGLVVCAAIAGAAYIRLAPSDPARWHVDPFTVEKPAFPGYALVRPTDGGATSPVFRVPADRLMAEIDAIAMSEPRVTRLAGSVAEGHVTYVARSEVMGFPDYISVRVLPVDDGAAQLAALSRLRFGYDDFGVNRTRLEGWLAALTARLPVRG